MEGKFLFYKIYSFVVIVVVCMYRPYIRHRKLII